MAFTFAPWAGAAQPERPTAPAAPTAPTAPTPAPQAQPTTKPEKEYLRDLVLIPSEFDDSQPCGKDPFFPKSERTCKTKQSSTPRPSLLTTLKLRGLSRSPTQRMVLINKYTLAEGEEREIRVDDQVHKLGCVEVREKSVLISIDGQPMELFLPADLF